MDPGVLVPYGLGQKPFSTSVFPPKSTDSALLQRVAVSPRSLKALDQILNYPGQTQ